jgi:GT2 family glycosyltransferase
MLGVPCLAEPYDLLTRALHSFCTRHVRVVAIDNGAQEETRRAIAAMGSRIEVIRNEKNVYVNPAWNQLAERFLASGLEILVIANADLIAGSNWAASLLLRHEQARRARVSEFWYAHWAATVEQAMQRRVPSAARAQTGTRGASGGFIALPRAAVKKAFPIPSELLIWYGDSWINDLLCYSGYRSVLLRDMVIWQAQGISTSSLPLEERTRITDGEKRIWDTYLGEVCQRVAAGYRNGAMTHVRKEEMLVEARSKHRPT